MSNSITRFGSLVIGLTLMPMVSAYFTACMRENGFQTTTTGIAQPSRCGTCMEGSCGDYAPVQCEFFDQTAEEVEFNTLYECSTYVEASTQVTTPEMQDTDTGVPHFGYAATMLFFSASVSEMSASDQTLLNATSLGFNATQVNATQVKGIPSCFKGSSPSVCKTGVRKFLNGTFTGKDLQNCGNAYVVKCGKYGLKAVQVGLCAYLTSGVGSTFCNSKAAEAVYGVINNFADKYLKPIAVKVVTKIEDAAVSVAKNVGHWFMSLF